MIPATNRAKPIWLEINMVFGGEERRQGLLAAEMRSPTDFEMTARDVLSFLNQRLGFGLWMITRIHEDDWIVLQARDFDYDILPGMVFHWGDSYCIHMVRGDGPRIAPRVKDVPVYSSAKLAFLKPVEAYIGVPITLSSGELFGTLCAFDPQPQPDTLENELKMVELFAAMLGKLAEGELKSLDKTRMAERSFVQRFEDPLTRQIGIEGWEQIFAIEENRCRRYGSAAAVASINLDGLKEFNQAHGRSAGDDLLRASAVFIRGACRQMDVVARIGGDQFGVLFLDCGETDMLTAIGRISDALTRAGIEASIGCARRDPSLGLEMAMANADSTMVVRKRVKRHAA